MGMGMGMGMGMRVRGGFDEIGSFLFVRVQPGRIHSSTVASVTGWGFRASYAVRSLSPQ